MLKDNRFFINIFENTNQEKKERQHNKEDNRMNDTIYRLTELQEIKSTAKIHYFTAAQSSHLVRVNLV